MLSGNVVAPYRFQPSGASRCQSFRRISATLYQVSQQPRSCLAEWHHMGDSEHRRPGVVLQLATMVEKVECCERSHAQLERHALQQREQLQTQQVTHEQQNAELRSVLQDSQAGLKHLLSTKVRAPCGKEPSERRYLFWSLRSTLHKSHMPGRDVLANPYGQNVLLWSLQWECVVGGTVTSLL